MRKDPRISSHLDDSEALFGQLDQLPVSTTSCTVPDLHPGARYTFQVAGANVLGAGQWSDPSGIVVCEDVPGAPSALEIRACTDTSVTIAWAPAFSYGLEITHERIDVSPTPASSRPIEMAACGMYEVTGLEPKTEYTFRVRSRNSRGLGPLSEPVSVTTFGKCSRAEKWFFLYFS